MAVQISQDPQEQERQHLREHGYRWTKVSGNWQLIGPTGLAHTKKQALHDIEHHTVPVHVPVYSHMDRPAAVRWAQALVSRPQTARTVLVLDTETSGLGEDAVVLEVSIVDLSGNVVFDALFDPGDVAINPEAAMVNGITPEMLREAAPVPALWDSLCSILERGEIIIYNAQFDVRLLKQTAAHYGLKTPDMVTHCLMKQYER